MQDNRSDQSDGNYQQQDYMNQQPDDQANQSGQSGQSVVQSNAPVDCEQVEKCQAVASKVDCEHVADCPTINAKFEAIVKQYNTQLDSIVQQYNSFVNSFNTFTTKIYDNAMTTTRVVASKVRLFGSAMAGEELDKITKTDYQRITQLKQSAPKVYQDIFKFAKSIENMPIEKRPETIVMWLTEFAKTIRPAT